MTSRAPPGSVMFRFFEHCDFSKTSSKQPKKSPGWLSKPIRFRNQSSRAPQFSKSPASLTELAGLLAALGQGDFWALEEG